MSILQEYESIRKDIGEETYNAIERYLELHPELLLSDIYYKRTEWEKFEEWHKIEVFNNMYKICHPEEVE